MPERNTEPTDERVEEAGKPPMDDEVLPDRGDPVPQENTGGDEMDPLTGEKDGDLAVEGAQSLERTAKEESRKGSNR